MNAEKAVEAKNKMTKPANFTLSNFKMQKARNDSILRTDDRYANLQLDLTRNERIEEIKSRTSRNRNKIPIYFK